VGDHTKCVAIDTGAPVSMLYAPRGDDLPEDAVRRQVEIVRLRVGELTRELIVERLEPLLPPGFDGLLGMDVLRDCALAMDATRLVARCSESSSLGAPAGDLSLYHKQVRFGDEGPWLSERANGGYAYFGDELNAEVHPDGSLEVTRRRATHGSLSMRSEREEREWLLDLTALARYHLRRQRDLDHSFAWLPHHLAAVWGNRRWSTAERREILFRIWDEAAEPDDPELAAAGLLARHIIDRFVRAQLPPASRDHFTDGELASFNARRARGPRFDPYHPIVDRAAAE